MAKHNYILQSSIGMEIVIHDNKKNLGIIIGTAIELGITLILKCSSASGVGWPMT